MVTHRNAPGVDHELAIGRDAVRPARTEPCERTVFYQRKFSTGAGLNGRFATVVVCCALLGAHSVCSESIAACDAKRDSVAEERLSGRAAWKGAAKSLIRPHLITSKVNYEWAPRSCSKAVVRGTYAPESSSAVKCRRGPLRAQQIHKEKSHAEG